MTYNQELHDEIRSDQASCMDDAINEAWSDLGRERHMEIINELRDSGSKDEGGSEAMELWFQETAEFFDFKAIDELMAWLDSDEADDDDRMEVVSSGYNLTQQEVVDRFTNYFAAN